MTDPVIPKLKIQELVGLYGETYGKGRLFVATPTRGKPRAVSAEQWSHDVLRSAEKSAFKSLVVQWSFWPGGLPPASTGNGGRHIEIIDTAAGMEKFGYDTPQSNLEKVRDLLSAGQDLLLVAASKKIPGFVPAVLCQSCCPEIHTAKILYPLMIGENYELTPFQIGYITGRGK
jgi:hypothetical protein|tara:strand:- start:2329 stop:2850 length:522 start_codon:yes stop_codon:yes gene_type:complete